MIKLYANLQLHSRQVDAVTSIASLTHAGGERWVWSTTSRYHIRRCCDKSSIHKGTETRNGYQLLVPCVRTEVSLLPILHKFYLPTTEEIRDITHLSLSLAPDLLVEIGDGSLDFPFFFRKLNLWCLCFELQQTRQSYLTLNKTGYWTNMPC